MVRNRAPSRAPWEPVLHSAISRRGDGGACRDGGHTLSSPALAADGVYAQRTARRSRPVPVPGARSLGQVDGSPRGAVARPPVLVPRRQEREQLPQAQVSQFQRTHARLPHAPATAWPVQPGSSRQMSTGQIFVTLLGHAAQLFPPLPGLIYILSHGDEQRLCHSLSQGERG